MNTIHKISLTCKEATDAYSRGEGGRISFVLRMRLFIHYMSCPPCRRFIHQCKLILKRIRSYHQSISVTPSHQLGQEKKQSMQDKINKLS